MPVPYLGQTLTCRVRATDPVTQEIITDAGGQAAFFAPPKNPAVNPDDRTPDVLVALIYDPVTRYYLARFPTDGAPWVAGVWWCRTSIVGGKAGYSAWAYTSFPLSA
jgi:hypothetical protein